MKKFFKTYWPFAINEIKTNFAYKGSFYLFILSRVLGIFISYFLWMAIYGSSTSQTLGGLTQNEMIVYIFMSYVATGLIAISISGDIGFHVVEGSIASNMIKPIDYRSSLLFKAIGAMIYRFFVPSLFIWIGLETYKFFILKVPFTGISNIILFLISCILSFLIYVFFDFCFGMLAFSLDDVDLTTNLDQKTVHFTFNKNKINVSELISHIMTLTEIKDIKIEETEISQIVKEIYKNGL